MAKPNKKRGFRTITVDTKKYCWRLAGFADIRSEQYPNGQKLRVEYGYYCVWDYVNGEEEPDDFYPKVFTPKYVEKAIRFAKGNGWNPESTHGVLWVDYKHPTFTVRKS